MQQARSKQFDIGPANPFPLFSSVGGGRGQWLGRHHGDCGARAYNGGLRAEPPAGSRGRAPVRGSGGEAALKLKAFWSLDVQRSRQIKPLSKNVLSNLPKQYALLRSTAVRVGGPECKVPPTPSLGAVPMPPDTKSWRRHWSPPLFKVKLRKCT